MRILALLIALVAAGPALALSCIRPDVATTFGQAQASDDNYFVALGDITFDETKLPKRPKDDPNNTVPSTLIPAKILGQSLTLEGFNQTFNGPLTLNVTCAGPWCGNAISGQSYLVFVKDTEDGLVLDIGPCGGHAFPEPTKEDLNRVLACAKGETCEPAVN